MATITVSEDIRAPIERVFEIASNIPNAAQTVGGIVEIETLCEAPAAENNNGVVGLGYAWRETRVMFGKKAIEDMTVVEWSPPSRYSVEARSHGTHYLSSFDFERIDHATTRITMSFNATPESFGAKVMMRVFSFMTKTLVKCIAKDLRDIKVAAERSSDEPSA